MLVREEEQDVHEERGGAGQMMETICRTGTDSTLLIEYISYYSRARNGLGENKHRFLSLTAF